MNSEENTVQCSICGEQIPARLFYFHQLEKACKPLGNPNQPSFVQPSVVQNSNVIRIIPHSQIQQQFPPVEQRQPMSQSMINELVIKCDYCQDEYPREILQQHLECCPAKKELEQMQNEFFDAPEPEPVQRQHQAPVGQRIPEFNDNLIEDDFGGLDHFRNARVEHFDNDGRVQMRHMEQSDNFPFPLPGPEFNPFRMIFGNGGVNPPFGQFRHPQRRIERPDQIQDFLELLMRSIHPQDEPARDVNELNVIVFQKSNNLAEEHTRCAICMSDYEDQEQLILLPCTHRYHAECIKKWLEAHHECPVCKYDLNKQQQQQ